MEEKLRSQIKSIGQSINDMTDLKKEKEQQLAELIAKFSIKDHVRHGSTKYELTGVILLRGNAVYRARKIKKDGSLHPLENTLSHVDQKDLFKIEGEQ